MSQSSSYKIALWFNAACLSLLLPLFVSSNAWAQNCMPADVKEQIQKLKDDKSRKAASDVLVKCGENAIAPLAEALSDSNAVIRGNVADSLGKIGWTAREAVPELVEALGDEDTAVRQNSVRSLIAIGRSAQKQADNFSEIDLGAVTELESLKKQIEKALKGIDPKYQEWKNQKQARQELRLTKNPLQTKVKHLQARIGYRSVEWVSKNPWISLLLAGLGYLGIFALRPLWLLQLDKVLQSQTIKLPFVGFNLPLEKVLFFKYHSTVLDAWVKKHLDSVQKEFLAKDIVTRDRTTHVPLPVVLNSKTLIPAVEVNDNNPEPPEHKPLQQALQPLISKEQQFCLLIQGEGGAGKTSLACQIARWGMEGKLSNHLLLPVLIDRELQEHENLLQVIQNQLQDLTNTGDEEIQPEYLKNLLQQRRVLVIVDHFSELAKPTRDKILEDISKSPIVNALIITSRLAEELNGIPKSTLKPMRVEGERISEFLGEYLKLRDKRDKFDDEDFLSACLRLKRMVGQRNITILLAKLYADQMIANTEGTGDLPENIPELMLSYLNQLNSNAEGTQQLAVHRDAQAVSWKCLEQTYRPAPVQRKTALEALKEVDDTDDANTRLNHLETSLKLLQKVEPDKIRITLDPLAEYLAGLHLVEKHKDNEAPWNELLKDIREKPENLEAIQGFLKALWDCCELKKKELKIPENVVEELVKIAGLDPKIIEQKEQESRIKRLINDLSMRNEKYRADAVTELGTIGKAAKKAVRPLRKVLENDSEVAKTRREAAKPLKQLGEDIPMLIAEIKDGVESIRLVEHPPTVEIDLPNDVILEMAEIPGGTFLMGSPPEEEESSNNERPQHKVTVAPFLMGKYPITQAQWKAVAALPQVERELEPNPSRFQGANRPVERVSWYDAVEFCARISQHTGQEFRLPSEAEWEYACRAGTTTPFHFGETISTDLANYNGSHIYGSGERGVNRSETTPVGMFQVANAFGLYDMHGNVLEWCLDDSHDNYEGAPTDGSAWFDDNDNLSQETSCTVLRGGFWGDNPYNCRSACRINDLR
ncbi:MAG: SUMF1/EgtB/PvdO family nonheme iron enzyme [Calothrix sp. MO_167.B12]|nr:SUMF1/EgtB/PvdO family nonheme iron enzyme [Calothrix sp. MO_167.B12]